MSLKKIAAMTGVSASTVSRVLNNTSSSCASKETQDKIWAAAREIGYCPNEAAQNLKKPQKAAGEAVRRVIIVMARVASLDDDPFFLELFRSLEIELMKRKTVISQVVYADESLSVEVSDADGVIVLGRCSQTLIDHIISQNKNTVGLWRNSMNFCVDEVICDGEKAAELAMRYLLSLGHQKIAYIGDCSYESRYVGYCNTLIQNHLSMDYNLICPTDQTSIAAAEAFSKLLEKRQSGKLDFTAAFCANDATAIGVLNVLKTEKKHIRQSISVISIDDIDEAQSTTPYLTTIRIPHEEMAHMAVELLLDRIAKGHKEPVRIEFPCRLVVRESCYQKNI